MNKGTHAENSTFIITSRNITGPCSAVGSPVWKYFTMPSMGPKPSTVRL